MKVDDSSYVGPDGVSAQAIGRRRTSENRVRIEADTLSHFHVLPPGVCRDPTEFVGQ